ncbi:MAG: WG repeat-containing protein [Rikenellaceae bacterium]
MAATSVIKILDSVIRSQAVTRSLGKIKLWRDEDGSVLYYVGNSIVLFKIRHQGEWKAMRCYTRNVPRLAEIYNGKYLAEELYVYSGSKSGVWIDVVLEDWVDGTTLRKCTERAIENNDTATLTTLANRFDSLACELLHSDWSHGDLTAENILVTPELQLRLIDFDCKFMPQFAGQHSSELGTASYQPPSRKLHDFDKDIDDYSIALISTALRALTISPEIYHKYGFYDGLIFSPALIERGRCCALDEVKRMFLSRNMGVAYRVAMLLEKGTLRIAHLRNIFSCTDKFRGAELQLFMKHGFVGYTTMNGDVVIPPIYDDGLSFKDNIAKVKLESKWIGINPQNEVVEEPKRKKR